MIRRADNRDIEPIMHIVRSAQEALRDLGIDQWQDGYPSTEAIAADIEQAVGYVYCDNDDHVVGYAAIVLTGEEAYSQIADDAWGTPDDYVVVHRLCVDGTSRRNGIAVKLMQHAANIARRANIEAFRIDTHRGNIRMLAMLDKLGFEYRGIVYYTSGERLAFDLNLNTSKMM